jgi:HK97 gp10 family phage protein
VANRIGVTITGVQELQGKLRALDLVVRRELLLEAATAGGEIVLTDARANAPRATGALAEGLTLKEAGRVSDSREGVVDVGPDKMEFYGFFIEFGTAFLAPRPFLMPALENNRERITQVMGDILWTAIDREAT